MANEEITIRKASNSEHDLCRQFYTSVGYTTPIVSSDEVLFALSDQKIIALVRLCKEFDHLVLRGMEVSPEYQRRGIGSQLLHNLSAMISNRECWCLPYSYLEDFYGQIGFIKMDTLQAPEFLRKRLSDYCQKNTEKKFILMLRSKGYNNALADKK